MIGPRRDTLSGWGRANHARSWVYEPERPGEVAEALRDACDRGLSVVHRGAGQSYGDAALNQGGAVIETGGLDRILAYDPEQGRIRAEAGVSIDRLWRHVIADGWWPPVVPGTSRPTLGGCLAMNVHGKNHVQAGSFAEHVRSVTVLGPDGEKRRLGRDDPGFERVAGAQGLTGTILSMELELTAVTSGYLEVEARTAPDLAEAMQTLRAIGSEHEYAVAWVDAFARGGSLGRAEVHGASCLAPEHPEAGCGLSVKAQKPPSRVFGLLTRRRVSGLLRLAANDPGMRSLNAARYAHARALRPSRYLQPHVQFHFLLDYMPDWKSAYGPEGLIQYQFFVPGPRAEEVFRAALRRQHERGVVSYLAVLKRHRRDPFRTNYSVDGYSLALDFPVRTRSLPQLMRLVAEFDALQSEAGGRVYAAKDAVSRLGSVPEGRGPGFSSNLVRRWGECGSPVDEVELTTGPA